MQILENYMRSRVQLFIPTSPDGEVDYGFLHGKWSMAQEFDDVPAFLQWLVTLKNSYRELCGWALISAITAEIPFHHYLQVGIAARWMWVSCAGMARTDCAYALCAHELQRELALGGILEHSCHEEFGAQHGLSVFVDRDPNIRATVVKWFSRRRRHEL